MCNHLQYVSGSCERFRHKLCTRFNLLLLGNESIDYRVLEINVYWRIWRALFYTCMIELVIIAKPFVSQLICYRLSVSSVLVAKGGVCKLSGFGFQKEITDRNIYEKVTFWKNFNSNDLEKDNILIAKFCFW